MNKTLCLDAHPDSHEIDYAHACWVLLKTVARYLGISNRYIKKLKKRFYQLSQGQQQLVTQTWIRIGHLQDYGMGIGFFNDDEIVLMDTPLDLLIFLVDAVEQDIDAAIWQWSVTKELLDRITAMKAIEGVLA